MAAAAATSNDSSSSSASPVSSPSSVIYVDLYGKRRQVAKIQVLDREIALLQDEIKSLVDLQPASTCCKELDDHLETIPDPLIAINKRSRGESRSFWKNIGRKFGSVICCNTKACCACFSGGKESCCGGRKKACSPGCCKCLACNCSCSCNPSWPKCLVCCCCKSCSCF